jgi:hypothetical protein
MRGLFSVKAFLNLLDKFLSSFKQPYSDITPFGYLINVRYTPKSRQFFD